MTLLGPYLVACALLGVAGVGKALRPLGTARALGPLMPRVPPALLRMAIRTLALAEAGLGIVGALAPNRPLAAAVAGSYLAFALFVLYVRARHGALASCGCFSTPDTPATTLHAAVDLALATAAGTMSAVGAHDSMLSVLFRQPLDGVPLLAVCAIGAWLAFLVLVGLARLSAARRLVEGQAFRRSEKVTWVR